MHISHQKERFSIAYVRALAAQAACYCDEPEVDDDSVDLRSTPSSTAGWRQIGQKWLYSSNVLLRLISERMDCILTYQSKITTT